MPLPVPKLVRKSGIFVFCHHCTFWPLAFGIAVTYWRNNVRVSVRPRRPLKSRGALFRLFLFPIPKFWGASCPIPFRFPVPVVAPGACRYPFSSTSSSVPEKRPPPAPSNLSPNAASAGRARAPRRRFKFTKDDPPLLPYKKRTPGRS